MLVCGDVVYAQTWQVLTLKNCIEPLSYASTAYFVAWLYFPFDCFVKIWATCKNFLGKWTTAPPGKKLPVRLCIQLKYCPVLPSLNKVDYYYYWKELKRWTLHLVHLQNLKKSTVTITINIYYCTWIKRTTLNSLKIGEMSLMILSWWHVLCR